VIFVDSNIPMYLVGAPHPNKDAARRALESSIERGERLVTDAEVLQEILHRYAAIRSPDAVQPAFRSLLAVVDEVFPIERADVERARDVLLGLPGEISARDALHVAIMQSHGVSRVMSFDRGFDRFTWMERLSG
jgi:predicted nucleic acid-binding protein